MKIIYDDKTTALINQLQETLEAETGWLISSLKKQGAGAMRIRTEVQCNSRLNLIRNELVRLRQIAMPIRYEFESTEE